MLGVLAGVPAAEPEPTVKDLLALSSELLPGDSGLKALEETLDQSSDPDKRRLTTAAMAVYVKERMAKKEGLLAERRAALEKIADEVLERSMP